MRVVIVGGGIAGLAAAVRLRDRAGPAVEIIVVDRAGRVGGKLHTEPLAGVPLETGAETFLLREAGQPSAVHRLTQRLGLPLVSPAPVPAAIADERGLADIPAGTLLGIPSTMDEVDGGTPLLAPGEDIAVGRLVRARYGDDIVDRLVDPMLGGVYAGHADKLSLAATVPALHRAAARETTLGAAVRAAMRENPRPAGSPVFATVPGGLSRLVRAAVDAAAADVRLGLPVRELARTPGGWRLVVGSTREPVPIEADAVVLAVPARPSSRLLAGVDDDLATTVGVLDYASVALVSLALPPGTDLPELSGFLVPAVIGRAVKAATFFSRKWPVEPGAPVFVRASFGRYCEERVLQRADADLIDLARSEVSDLIGSRLPVPLVARVSRWGGGLPQYGVGHVDRVAAVRAALPPTLALAGAAFDGVGIAACVRSGEAAADQVLESLARPVPPMGESRT